jgi:hypothetical protein
MTHERFRSRLKNVALVAVSAGALLAVGCDQGGDAPAGPGPDATTDAPSPVDGARGGNLGGEGRGGGDRGGDVR